MNEFANALSLSYLALKKLKSIHFIGIGGIGMSGIAKILHELGHTVTGSDKTASKVTSELEKSNIGITIGHKASNIHLEIDLVVVTSALDNQNPELKEAIALNIPVISRGEMLATLMHYRYGIAVAGTHGKTTTTSMLAAIFLRANLKPGYAIGGVLKETGANAELGESAFFIAESDESDQSFLALSPEQAIITNIDYDHMERYEENYLKVNQSFIDFTKRLPFYGLLAVNIDCPMIQKIKEDFNQVPSVSFGFSDLADIQAINIHYKNGLCQFKVLDKLRNRSFEVSLNMPGKHNVLNALGAIVISCHHQIEISVIQKALANFQGVSRRFEVRAFHYNKMPFTVINDYGHHPAELQATLQTIQLLYPSRRMIHLFQPHRYTRTKLHFDGFIEALKLSDERILLKTYSASENPSLGVGSEALADKLKTLGFRCEHANNHKEAENLLKVMIQADDIVLIQGAGDVNQLVADLEKW